MKLDVYLPVTNLLDFPMTRMQLKNASKYINKIILTVQHRKRMDLGLNIDFDKC